LTASTDEYGADAEPLQQYVVDEPQTMIPGIHNLGGLGAEAFVDEMANSRVLVGIGEVRQLHDALLRSIGIADPLPAPILSITISSTLLGKLGFCGSSSPSVDYN